MRTTRALLAVLALAGVVATGCGSSSGGGGGSDSGSDGNSGGKDSGKDSGKDGPGHNDTGSPDTGPLPDGTTPPDGASPDSGGCTFAGFVIGLIKNDTTATATPSTDLGASCSDDQKQSDFASLFP